MIYREEIDGLRAVAVLPVILYHAGFTRFFAGGYIGVDIFFVISGYLITSVIDSECQEGSFSLVAFYERRCRRILPALFLILFVSSVFAYHWMLPEQLKEFGQTLISILGLSSNFFFWWKDDGYFTQVTELNPLVHTWSLAVEEQFYFIFPLVCYLLRGKERPLLALLLSATLFSFGLAQWGGNLQSTSAGRFHLFSQHSWASFYLPLGRMWELLLGTLAALHVSVRSGNQHRQQVLAFVGLVLIAISIWFFDISAVPPFPNGYTLLPTCGTVLVILFAEKDTLVGRLLSIPPLRWIGLVSYSAYLWHQPLLAFLRLRSTESSSGFPLLLVLSAVLPLSALSYRFIEQPFRKKNFFTRKTMFLAAGTASLITLLLASHLIRTANIRSVAMSQANDPYLFELEKYGSVEYVISGFDKLEKKSKALFSNDTATVNRKIVLIGDSFAQDFYNMIVEGKHLAKYEIRVHFIYARCQIYLGPEDRRQFIEARHRQTCTNANDIQNAFPLIRRSNIVMLASNWQEWSGQRLPGTLQLLNLTKQQQVFVIGAKHLGHVNPQLYVNKTMSYRLKQRLHPRIVTTKVNDLLARTIDPSVFVNVQKMICTGYNHTCSLFTPAGKLISHDGAHLTKFGALHVGNIIFKNKPLNRL